MIELREWIAATTFAQRPWLLVGKGPSFSRRHDFPLQDFNLMGLNDVVREMKLNIAHIIDLDVAQACAEHLRTNCDYLIMPRRPHVSFEVTAKLLEDFFDAVPVLRVLSSEGRLVWYNSSLAPPIGDSPVIGVSFFSSEAALNILGEMGVRKVRSLGIDGGRSYGREFSDLEELTNRRPSFDAQFREIEDIVRDRGIDYDPLLEPMRVFIGCDESQIVAARVLEYSIRKHASRPVRVMPMLDIPTSVPKDPRNRGRTGFSFSRFHIPKLAGYEGRALYLDADMQVFDDLAELWEIPLGKHKVLCTRQDEPPAQWRDVDWFKPGRQMSVMLLDCSRLNWDVEEIVRGLDERRYSYEELMFDLCIVDPGEIADDISPEWNHLEHYEPQRTKLLHYTVVPTQPWKNDLSPLQDLWLQDFWEAEAAGVVKQSELERGAIAGHLKPSLAHLTPARRVFVLIRSAASPLRRVVRAAERRFPLLAHPALANWKVRARRVRRRIFSGAPRART